MLDVTLGLGCVGGIPGEVAKSQSKLQLRNNKLKPGSVGVLLYRLEAAPVYH